MMWKRVVAVTTMLGSMLAQGAAARQCGDFGNDGCGANDHYVWGGGANNKNPHSHCYGPCAPGVACHPVCSEALASNPLLHQNYQALLAAANDGDVSTILELAASAPGFVAFNAERRSLQVKGCTGRSIIANVPVRNSALLRLAMRLPSPAEVLATTLPSTAFYLAMSPLEALGSISVTGHYELDQLLTSPRH